MHDLENLNAERVKSEQQLRRELANARMEAETDGYQLPNYNLPQIPADHSQERDYDRRERLRRMAEIQDEIDAPRLAKEREHAERFAAQQAELQSTANELAKMEREAILKGRDPEFLIDPATQGEQNAVPFDQLDTYQRSQFGAFLTANPDYFRCDENGAAISDYLQRNAPGLRLVSARQLTDAFQRLRQYGLLKERPTVATPAPVVQPEFIAVEDAPAEPSEWSMIGYDLETGGKRAYSQFEIERMSSAQYRKIFPTSAITSGIVWGQDGRI